VRDPASGTGWHCTSCGHHARRKRPRHSKPKICATAPDDASCSLRRMAPLLSRAKSERKYDSRGDNVHQGTTIPFHLVTLSQRFAFTRQGQQAGRDRVSAASYLGSIRLKSPGPCRSSSETRAGTAWGRSQFYPTHQANAGCTGGVPSFWMDAGYVRSTWIARRPASVIVTRPLLNSATAFSMTAASSGASTAPGQRRWWRAF
jgi:hypothetical protein